MNLVAFFIATPNYGLWTGIRPLEEKLKILEKFAKDGPVDAVILGASISDFGFSAELYSQLMSEKIGREYRVFNFSTGAAELSFMPILYRLVRTVAKPNTIIVLAPVQGKQDDILPAYSPDYILNNSPIGTYSGNLLLLRFSKLIWSLPILAKSAALRDLIIHGRFKNFVGQGMDLYPVTKNGDRLGYQAGMLKTEMIEDERSQRLGNVSLLPSEDEFNSRNAQNLYFANISINAMKELREMANSDGANFYVFGHAPASILWKAPIKDGNYLIARSQFFNVLSTILGATMINPLDNLSIPDFAVMDGSHLNTYGAKIYTEAVFRAFGGGSTLDDNFLTNTIEVASIEPIRSREKTFGIWSSLIMREEGVRHRFLKCKFLENFAIPRLPDSDLYFAVRMPDNTDIVLPAQKLKSGEYIANVDFKAANNPQVFILRLLFGGDRNQLNSPLEKCEWMKGS